MSNPTNMDTKDLYCYFIKDKLRAQLETESILGKSMQCTTIVITAILLLLASLLYLLDAKTHTGMSIKELLPTILLANSLLFAVICFIVWFLAWSMTKRTKDLLRAIETKSFQYQVVHDVHIITYGDTCMAQCPTGESYRVSPAYSGYPDTDLLVVEIDNEILTYVLDPIR